MNFKNDFIVQEGGGAGGILRTDTTYPPAFEEIGVDETIIVPGKT